MTDIVTQLALDAQKMHDIVHGDENTVVTTDGGPVRSVAKLIADNQAAIDDAAGVAMQLGSPGAAATIATASGSNVQAELDAKATPADIATAVSGLVNAAPGTLNTLKELADALGDDPNYAATVTAALGQKVNSADLAATGGAALVGTSDGSTVQAKLSANASAISANATAIAGKVNATDMAATGGAALVGTMQALTGAVARTVKDKLLESVSVLDFIDPAQHAAIKNGTSTFDCTAGVTAAFVASDEVRFCAGLFNVSMISLGNNKRLVTAGKSTTFKQISGQAVGTRMLCVTGSNVSLGDMTVRGNIATDTDEQNHAIFINATAANLRNICVGNIDGFDIRGDVVYIGCGSAYTLTSVKVGDVYGDNILRNVVTHCGGNGVEIGAITGNRVGLMMFDIEPESYNAPASGVKVAYIKGGRVGLLAPSTAAPISGVEIGAMVLDPSYQPMCSPSYAPGASVQDGLGVRNVLSAKIGYLKANGFNRCAIFTTYNSGELGASLDITQLDLSNCSLTDTTYNAFINLNNAGHLRIGSVKATVSTSGKYLMTNVTSGRIARCDVTLGTGAQMLRNCSNMVVENGAVGGGAGYMLTSCSNVAVKDVQFNGEVLASYSTKLSFENVSATCSTYAFNSGYDLHAVLNSTIAGSYYAGGTIGRDYSSPLRFGVIQFWADVKGVLRIKGSAPTSDMDGNPMGQKVTVPATATTAGAPGQWAADTSNTYFYTGDGTTHSWRRVATAAW
jgi:hypothetical protein